MVGMTTNERVGFARHDAWRKTAMPACVFVQLLSQFTMFFAILLSA
jgi:hypothetical protein